VPPNLTAAAGRQVAALRAVLKKRHDARQQIIDRRLEQVLQEAEGLGWSARATSRPQGGYAPQVK
jgi:hypothetical protein